MLVFSTGIMPAMAKIVEEKINVSFKDVTIVANGKEIIPKDVNGKILEPFIYNEEIYIPIRTVGEAFNKEVNWDEETSTIFLGKFDKNTAYERKVEKFIEDINNSSLLLIDELSKVDTSNKESLQNIVLEITTVENLYKSLADLKAPDGYKDYHNTIVRASNKMIEYFNILKDLYSNYDRYNYEGVSKKLEEATKCQEEAAVILATLDN